MEPLCEGDCLCKVWRRFSHRRLNIRGAFVHGTTPARVAEQAGNVHRCAFRQGFQRDPGELSSQLRSAIFAET